MNAVKLLGVIMLCNGVFVSSAFAQQVDEGVIMGMGGYFPLFVICCMFLAVASFVAGIYLSFIDYKKSGAVQYKLVAVSIISPQAFLVFLFATEGTIRSIVEILG